MQAHSRTLEPGEVLGGEQHGHAVAFLRRWRNGRGLCGLCATRL